MYTLLNTLNDFMKSNGISDEMNVSLLNQNTAMFYTAAILKVHATP